MSEDTQRSYRPISTEQANQLKEEVNADRRSKEISRNHKLSRNKKIKSTLKVGGEAFIPLVKLVVIFILLLIFIPMLQGDTPSVSFTSFLQGLSDFDVIPSIPFLNFQTKSLGDWTVYVWNSFDILGITFPAFTLRFNWLRDYFAWFLKIIDVLLFLINGLISLINFVIFFTRWMFY